MIVHTDKIVNILAVRILALVISLLFVALPVVAGQFTVTPIKLEFDPGARSGVVNVANEHDGPLHLQIKAFEWTQNDQGEDRYIETNDLVFFPKMMILKKSEERVLRIGMKAPPNDHEKTYRVFIQEIPEPKAQAAGTQIQVAIRLGVPVFIHPARAELRGTIVTTASTGGRVQSDVSNTGNAHVVVQSVVITGSDRDGRETFSQELSGWYLLRGAKRSYAASIPPTACAQTEAVSVLVTTSGFTLNDRVNVDPSLCLP